MDDSTLYGKWSVSTVLALLRHAGVEVYFRHEVTQISWGPVNTPTDLDSARATVEWSDGSSQSWILTGLVSGQILAEEEDLVTVPDRTPVDEDL